MARPTREESAARMEAKREAEDKAIEAKVQERIDSMLPGLLEKLALQLDQARAAGASASAPSIDGVADRSLLSELVVGIKRLADPSNKKRIVSPEEMQRREAAREKLTRLLIQAHANGNVPIYELRAPIYVDEQIIQPQRENPVSHAMEYQRIQWPRIPNESMVPINAVARDVFAAFLESIGGESPDKPQRPSFVLNGGVVMKARAEEEGPQIGNTRPEDARIARSRVMPDTRRVHVLGTVAPPAEEANMRFDQRDGQTFRDAAFSVVA